MSNLIVENHQIGSGDFIQKGQVAIVHYTGRLNDENGQKFDSSVDRGEPFQFTVGVGQVIPGWEIGLLGNKETGGDIEPMRVGDIRLLTIPPNMGYGQSGAGNLIPPNATLFFKVELLGIK